jgi:hypothetical protein
MARQRGRLIAGLLVERYKNIEVLTPASAITWQEMFTDIFRTVDGFEAYITDFDNQGQSDKLLLVNYIPLKYPYSTEFANEIITAITFMLQPQAHIVSDPSKLSLIYADVKKRMISKSPLLIEVFSK